MKFAGYVVALVLALNSVAFAGGDRDADADLGKPVPHTDLIPNTEPTLRHNISPMDAASGSRNAMLDAMESPFVRNLFHSIQLQLLQTPGDSLMHRFFLTDSVMAPIYAQFKMGANKSLESYSLNARSNMLQLVRGLTPQYDSFDKLLVEVAIDAGVQESHIRNRELYLMPGALNAATVSGAQDKIIVLVTDTLIATMSRNEQAAVIAHEIGHIRAEHPIKGRMHNFLMSIVAELFISGETKMNQQMALKLQQAEQAYSQVCNGACGHAQNLSELSANRKANTMASAMTQALAIKMSKLPKDALLKSIETYLTLLIKVGEIEKTDPRTIEYFRTLVLSIPRAGTFKMNAEEFFEHAKEISLANSRTNEKTADNISASLTRNLNLASASAKLMGSQFESADKEARQRIFEQIEKQAAGVERDAAKTGTLYQYVGSTHPSLSHRAKRILEIPAYPSLVFANGFLKLLLIHENLVKLEDVAKQKVALYSVSAKEVASYIESELQKYKAAGATETQLEEQKKEILEQFAKTKKHDVGNYRMVSRDRFAHETNVLNLIFDPQFPISAKRAPRFENLVQYLATQREIRMVAAASVNKPEYTEATHKQLELQDAFIKKVKGRLDAELAKTTDAQSQARLQQRSALLTQVMEATTSGELEEVRRSVTSTLVLESGYRNIDNKLPLKINKGESATLPFVNGAACSRLFN